jgi:hypothetical protein
LTPRHQRSTINKSKADQPIFFESDLEKDDFVGRIGGKGPCKAVFMWYETKAFRVISNYYGSDLVEVETKQKNGQYKEENLSESLCRLRKVYGRRRYGQPSALILREGSQNQEKLFIETFHFYFHLCFVISMLYHC